MSSSRLSCWQIFLIKDSTVPRRCKADVENWKLTSQFAPCYLILKVELTLIKQRLPMKIHISSLRNWSVLRNWWAYISNWQQLPGLPNAVLSCFLSFETKAECQWPPMLVFSLLFFIQQRHISLYPYVANWGWLQTHCHFSQWKVKSILLLLNQGWSVICSVQ